MLLDILNRITSYSGEDLTILSQRTLVVTRVNQAAKEVYESQDLAGSLREIVLDLDTGTQQVTLPFFVGHIRKVRYHDGRVPVTLQDQQPRYHYGLGNEVWPLQFRLLPNSPIARDLDNYSTVTVSIPSADTKEFSVILVGTTNNSHRVSEALSFAIGETSKESINNFASFESIRKNKVIDFDVTIKDADENIIAIIPNSDYKVEYQVLQVLDSEVTNNQNPIEVLYKTRFFPFQNDYDSFPCGDVYDDAIFYKYVEHEYSREKDAEGAVAALAKTGEIIERVTRDHGVGLEKKINFGPNPYSNMARFAMGRSRRSRYSY
jgi:hypothetical protein